MSWYCIELTQEQVDFGFVEIIRAEMAEIWISRGGLPDASLWLEQSEVVTRMYFSPILAELAGSIILRFNGAPCKDPQKEDLTFLMGLAHFDDPI